MSASIASSPARKEFVLSEDYISIFDALTFEDLTDAFVEYRALLQNKFDFESFKTLNSKLDEIEKKFTEKELQIIASREAANKLRLQLYDLELQFYENPDGLRVIDKSYAQQVSKKNTEVTPPSTSLAAASPVAPVAAIAQPLNNMNQLYLQQMQFWQQLYQTSYGMTPEQAAMMVQQQMFQYQQQLQSQIINANLAQAAATASVPTTPTTQTASTAVSATPTTNGTPTTVDSLSNSVEKVSLKSSPTAASAVPTTPKGTPTGPATTVASATIPTAPATSIPSAPATAYKPQISAPSKPRAMSNIGNPRPVEIRQNPKHHSREKPPGVLITRIKDHKGVYTSKLVDKLVLKINSAKHFSFVSSGSVTKKGNIRLNFAPGVLFEDLESAKVIPGGLELIDCPDWYFLSIHGIPENQATGKFYTSAELQEEIEGFGLKICRTPEMLGSHDGKAIAKIAFSTEANRDAAFFMRTFYFNGHPAKLRIFPDEWFGCDKYKNHFKEFKDGKDLSDLRQLRNRMRFFQANCTFNLQANHDLLFELVLQANIVLIQSCWKHNDGRPIERMEWTHRYEQYYYEQGGTRVALYATRRVWVPDVVQIFTKNPAVNAYYITDFLLVQVDRPSDLEPREFFEAIRDLLEEQDDGRNVIISGCFNLQHKLWDNSEAPPHMYANKLADLLTEKKFKRLSPFPSEFIDASDYYTNPTLLFAQVDIASRIHISDKAVLSDALTDRVADYHRLCWDIELPKDD